MANTMSAVVILAKFFVPRDRHDLVPFGFEAIDEMPNTNRHFNTLKRIGLKELAEFGRVRPGKRDSGDNIASPDMASAPTFLESMQRNGLAILSAKRYLEENRKNKDGSRAKDRHVIVLGIGFADHGIDFKPADQRAIANLFKNTWQQCHVWDNSRPRDAGIHTVDTINFVGALESGAKPLYELMINDSANLEWTPLHPTAKPLKIQPDAAA